MGKSKKNPDAALRKIVTGFRRGLLGNRPSTQMCFTVCAPLQGLLEIYGHKTEMVEGDFGHTNHFWLRFSDGRIIDPTADQFKKPDGGKMPRVYIGEKPEWYKEA